MGGGGCEDIEREFLLDKEHNTEISLVICRQKVGGWGYPEIRPQIMNRFLPSSINENTMPSDGARMSIN